MMLLIDFNRYSPFRRPRWRLERVLQLVDRPTSVGRATRHDDQYVKALRIFMVKFRNGDDVDRNALGFENPGLYWAYLLFDRRNDDAIRMTAMLEARILARMSDEEIATELNTIPEVVLWYEALFFNVRDRIDAHDWILDTVLIPAIERDQLLAAIPAATRPNADASDNTAAPVRMPAPTIVEPFMDSSLKFFAYYGGRHVVDIAMGGFRRGTPATSVEDASSYFDRVASDKLRSRMAAAMTKLPINRYNASELLTTYMQLLTIERSSNTAENKREQIHNSVSAMMNEMRWAVGDDGSDSVKDTPLASYDTNAAELRVDEMQLLAAGHPVLTIEGVQTLTLPAPVKRQEEPK